MPEEKSQVPEVNLLPGDDLEGRPGGIFLKWALTWGKRIVVTTELIVILAFLSRFWLDTEVANLAEKIGQKKMIIQSEEGFEEKFRALSERMNKASSIEKLPSPLFVYDKVQVLIPSTIFVSRLSVDSHSVSLAGSADEASLGKLVDTFKNSAEFTDVSVGGVSQTGESATVGFSLRASFIPSGNP